MTMILENLPLFYELNAGKRVRVIWNPKVELWFVYDFENDHAQFSIKRLEIHTVSVYGVLKPKYAPEGSPSFVGTIAGAEIVDEETAVLVEPHPYAPAKLFFNEDPVREFDHCRRLLLDGSKMYADSRTPQGIEEDE